MLILRWNGKEETSTEFTQMKPRLGRTEDDCAHIWERRYDRQETCNGYFICVSCGAWQAMDDGDNDEAQL